MTSKCEVLPKMESNSIAESIAPMTDADAALLEPYLPHESTSYEDSFEYLRLYYMSGNSNAYRYYDGENLVFFRERGKKLHYTVLKPLGPDAFNALQKLLSFFRTKTTQPIRVTFLDGALVNKLNPARTWRFEHYIFDLEPLKTNRELEGKEWKNVREKITQLRRHHPNIKMSLLSRETAKPAIHFIGEWKRQVSASREMAYLDVNKSKFAVRQYADKNDERDIWAYIFKDKNRIVALQVLYRVGVNAAAHTVGLANREYIGLSEYAQIVTWWRVAQTGIRYINDGPSWRPAIQAYKCKFNPSSVQVVYDCVLN